jgi:hypothetical protein
MSEIIKIILVFPLFLLFIYAPLPVLNKDDNRSNLNHLAYNLIISCNILLFLSFLPLPIDAYQNILIILYLLIFTCTAFVYKIKFNKKSHKNLILFFLSFFILACVIANDLNLGWDAKFFYYIKSLFFYEGLNIRDLNIFENNKWHPHFGSYLWAFFWKIPLFNIEYFGRLFYLFIFCFSIYFVCIKAEKNNFINYILYFLVLIVFFKYERFSGLQEVLIFSFLLISSKVLYDISNENKLSNIIILLLTTNLMIWIKSEGIVYAITIVIILLFNKNVLFKEKIYTFFTFITLFFLKLLIFKYYNFEINAQPYNLEYIQSISVGEFFYRIYFITIYLGYYSLKNTIFILGILLLIYLNFSKTNKISLLNYNLFFILNTGFIFSAYLLRDLEIEYSLRTTLERITFMSSSFYLYLILLFINNQIKLIRKWKK